MFLVGVGVCFDLIMDSLGLWFDLDRFVKCGFEFWILASFNWWVCLEVGYVGWLIIGLLIYVGFVTLVRALLGLFGFCYVVDLLKC